MEPLRPLLSLAALLLITTAGPAAHGAEASLTDARLREIRSRCEERRDTFFRHDSGRPFSPAPIKKDWNGRGDFTRDYVHSTLLFAWRALRLNEQLPEANRALTEMCQYHLDRRQTLLEIHSFPGAISHLAHMAGLYGPEGSEAKGRLTEETHRVILATLWEWAKVKSRTADCVVDGSRTWTVTDSENHHASHFASCLAATAFLARLPDHAARRLDDGRTAKEHCDAWTAYLKEYLSERGRKGMTAEIESPSYAAATLGAVHWIHDLSEDPVLRRRAGDYIALYWALWAQQQIDGVSGGAKTRCYPKAAPGGGGFVSSAAWYVLGVGTPDFVHVSMLPFVTSTWKTPDLLIDLANDLEGRGAYEVTERRPGLSQPGAERRKGVIPLAPEGGGLVRHTFCTPDFVMGSLFCAARPNADWTAISAQNRWNGVIFRGARNARIYAYCETDDSSYNQQWAVQRGGTQIVQKLRTGLRPGGLRVWMSASGLSTPSLHDGWFVTESAGARAAVRVVSGEVRLLEPETAPKKKPARRDPEDVTEVPEGKPVGWVLECSDEFSPVVIETATKSEHPTREGFLKAIQSREIAAADGRLNYTGLRGDRFTFFTDQSALPRINDAPVDLAPARVYDSPFVQADWKVGRVTIQKGGRRLLLDFNE